MPKVPVMMRMMMLTVLMVIVALVGGRCALLCACVCVRVCFSLSVCPGLRFGASHWASFLIPSPCRRIHLVDEGAVNFQSLGKDCPGSCLCRLLSSLLSLLALAGAVADGAGGSMWW